MCFRTHAKLGKNIDETGLFSNIYHCLETNLLKSAVRSLQTVKPQTTANYKSKVIRTQHISLCVNFLRFQRMNIFWKNGVQIISSPFLGYVAIKTCLRVCINANFSLIHRFSSYAQVMYNNIMIENLYGTKLRALQLQNNKH